MKVYIVKDPVPNNYGGTDTELTVYSEAAALRLSRAAAQLVAKVREYGDMRTDAEALDDFLVVHWAYERTVLE